ncbi:MAG: PfkB family carbohydrate kinase [Leifsonia sp.]
MKMLGFGDNIIDRFVDRRIIYPGGNCVNFAVYARQLGADSAYLGVFGSDDYGRLLRDSLLAQGIAVEQCVIREGESGVSDIRVEDGDRVFEGWNGGGVTVIDPLIVDDDLRGYISDFALVHSSVYSSSESELPKLRSLDSLVSFDFSSEPDYRTPDYLDRVCPHIDLGLVSGSDLPTSDVEALLIDLVTRGATLALATCGTAGAILWDGQEFVRGEAVEVAVAEIVDTMGCGDAYLTGFAVHMMKSGWTRQSVPQRDDLAACLLAAAAFAAEQCLVEGAFGHGSPF